MAESYGRGGAPSGFIGRSTQSDLHRSTSTDEERFHSQSGTITNGSAGPTSGPIDLDAESSLITIRDLRKSGLEVRDINARVLGNPERAVCGVPSRGEGYVIPYFDISGEPLTFYRARILNANYATNGIKYKQPRKTANHIYFPRFFRERFLEYISDKKIVDKVLIITEGEKKAACAQKFGFPAIGLSGVDSWRSRTIVLPEDTEFYSTDEAPSKTDGRPIGRPRTRGQITARLPSTDASVPELVTLAKGFGDFIDLITQYRLHPVIVYDSDRSGTVKAEVQRAATMLAYELVFLGIPARNIRQVILPIVNLPQDTEEEVDPNEIKTGLDDFIMDRGPDELKKLIDRALSNPQAFPRHPNPKGFISTQLQNRASRKCMMQVAAMILTELDAVGSRLIDRTTGMPYYYDKTNAVLVPAKLSDNRTLPFHEQKFGQLLYSRYGVSANDNKVLVWLASQFTGEEPIEEVTPRRIIALITEKEDATNPYGVALQVSDSQYISISPDPKEPIKVRINGSLGILFEQDQVEPVDVDLLLEYFDHQLSEALEHGQLHSWWADVLNESTIGIQQVESAEPDEDGNVSLMAESMLTEQGKEMRTYATLLSYVSPFLLRWRGLQLPIELTIGPPGSGKSSLYSLRLEILTGRPKLRNIPSDIKDWQASLTHSGGLHVTDNVHFMNKELKQRVSDELCRITTEPNPQIEMRRYYTNTDVLRIPITAAFAFTAIQPPFINEDLIQRSVTFRTAYVDRDPEGNWVSDQLEMRGGREAWLAHHLVFLHLYLKREWNPRFRTQHRLAHLEQALTIASEVLDLEPLSRDMFADGSPVETTLAGRHDAVHREQLSLEVSVSTPEPVSEPGPELSVEARPTPSQSDPPELPPPPPVSVPESPPVQTPPDPPRNIGLSAPAGKLTLGATLLRNQAIQIAGTDDVLRAVGEFLQHTFPEYYRLNLSPPAAPSRKFVVGEISDWALGHHEFSELDMLINNRKLGRYFQERISTLHQILNVRPSGNMGNRLSYRLHPRT